MSERSAESYLTLLRSSQAEYVVQKSRFLCDAAPCETEEKALRFLQDKRIRYRDATHHCYAYVIGANAGIMRFSDDGEPSGTAGMPMMDVIKHRKIVNCCVVITRYFGGILLGAGGLVRAYSHSCALALETSGIALMAETDRGIMSVPYQLWNKVQYQLQSLPVQVVETSFGADVEATFIVRSNDRNAVEERITEQTNSQAEIIWISKTYEPWPITAGLGEEENES